MIYFCLLLLPLNPTRLKEKLAGNIILLLITGRQATPLVTSRKRPFFLTLRQNKMNAHIVWLAFADDDREGVEVLFPAGHPRRIWRYVSSGVFVSGICRCVALRLVSIVLRGNFFKSWEWENNLDKCEIGRKIICSEYRFREETEHSTWNGWLIY